MKWIGFDYGVYEVLNILIFLCIFAIIVRLEKKISKS